MAGTVKKPKSMIATIDCSLVTIEINSGEEFGFDTASKIEVEPQIEEQEGAKLVIKGVLRAQKRSTKVLTGNVITLTDNVFIPELVVAIQGGTVAYDAVDKTKIMKYTPPAAGSTETIPPFKLNAYSAQYNAAGQIVRYEKISYPNCTGSPISFNSEDGTFRAPEYEITSTPDTGEAPYTIEYVDTLPELQEPVTG